MAWDIFTKKFWLDEGNLVPNQGDKHECCGHCEHIDDSESKDVISSTDFSRDEATGILEDFMYGNLRDGAMQSVYLNALLADSSKFEQAPDGKPWRIWQILFGPEKAEMRLQLAQEIDGIPDAEIGEVAATEDLEHCDFTNEGVKNEYQYGEDPFEVATSEDGDTKEGDTKEGDLVQEVMIQETMDLLDEAEILIGEADYILGQVGELIDQAEYRLDQLDGEDEDEDEEKLSWVNFYSREEQREDVQLYMIIFL